MNGTAMCGNGDVKMTGITFLPTTAVWVFAVYDVDGAAVQTFPLFPASLGSEMKCQAMGTVKREIALVADGGGLRHSIVVWTWCWLIPIARATSCPFARVVGRIVMVIAAVALVAPITLIDEASEGGATLKMGV